MTDKENCIEKIESGNFNNGYGFDLSLLINAAGCMGEMLKKGEIARIVMCKDCKHGTEPPTFWYYPNLRWCNKYERSHDNDWFCADGERKDS